MFVVTSLAYTMVPKDYGRWVTVKLRNGKGSSSATKGKKEPKVWVTAPLRLDGESPDNAVAPPSNHNNEIPGAVYIAAARHATVSCCERIGLAPAWTNIRSGINVASGERPVHVQIDEHRSGKDTSHQTYALVAPAATFVVADATSPSTATSASSPRVVTLPVGTQRGELSFAVDTAAPESEACLRLLIDTIVAELSTSRARTVYPKTAEVVRTVLNMADRFVPPWATARTAGAPETAHRSLFEHLKDVLVALQYMRWAKEVDSTTMMSWEQQQEWIRRHLPEALRMIHACECLNSFKTTTSATLEKQIARPAAGEWRMTARVGSFRLRLSDRLAAATDDATVISQVGSDIGSCITAASSLAPSGDGGSSSLVSSVVAMLVDVQQFVSPLVEALPFGTALVGLVAGLYKCFVSRRELLRYAETLNSQLTLLIRVLMQEAVQRLINADQSTAAIMEEVLCAIDECSEAVQDYCSSNAAYQFFSGSRVEGEIQAKSAEITASLERLHHVVSLRTMASLQDHMRDVKSLALGSRDLLLQAADAIAIAASAHDSCLVPQLLEHLSRSEARVTAAIADNSKLALQTCSQQLEALLTTAAEAMLQMQAQQSEGMKTVVAVAVQSMRDMGDFAVKSGASAAAEAIHDFREYVSTELLPSMLASRDDDQHAVDEAIQTMRDELITKFSDISADHYTTLSRQISALVPQNDAVIAELRVVLDNIQWEARRQHLDLRTTLEQLQRAAADELCRLRTDCEAALIAEIDRASEGNAALHQSTRDAVTALCSRIDQLDAGDRERMELLMGTIGASVAQAVTDAIAAVQVPQIGDALSSLAQRQDAQAMLQNAKLDAIQQSQRDLIEASNQHAVFGASSLATICGYLRSSSRALVSLQGSVAGLTAVVSGLQRTMTETAKEQTQLLMAISGMSEVTAASVDRVFTSVREVHDGLDTEFQALHRALSSRQDATVEALKALLAEHAVDMFEKLNVQGVVSGLLADQTTALEAALNDGNEEGREALKGLQSTVKACARMIAHDVHVTKKDLGDRIRDATARTADIVRLQCNQQPHSQ